jgi:hypothetical protein
MQRLNKVRLSGRAGEIVFSHEHYGRYYYKFMLTVIRKMWCSRYVPNRYRRFHCT